jgi:YaiO family outer membrane protein
MKSFSITSLAPVILVAASSLNNPAHGATDSTLNEAVTVAEASSNAENVGNLMPSGAILSPSSESVSDSGAPISSPALSAESDVSSSESRGMVEFGVERSSLSNGFGNWTGVYTRGNWRANKSNVLNFEIARQNRFGESGTFYALGNTHTFNSDWYGSLTLGGSSGQASFLPRFRADAFIHRKLLPKRNLVATVGLGIYEASEFNPDRSLSLGATYYFPEKWIVEGGVRFNKSNPGSVDARSQFIAVTNGANRKRFVTLRHEFGNEAYQIVGNNAAISDFDSRVTSLTLRQWLGREQGFSLVVERYSNPFYRRLGASAGYFREF